MGYGVEQADGKEASRVVVRRRNDGAENGVGEHCALDGDTMYRSEGNTLVLCEGERECVTVLLVVTEREQSPHPPHYCMMTPHRHLPWASPHQHLLADTMETYHMTYTLATLQALHTHTHAHTHTHTHTAKCLAAPTDGVRTPVHKAVSSCPTKGHWQN